MWWNAKNGAAISVAIISGSHSQGGTGIPNKSASAPTTEQKKPNIIAHPQTPRAQA